MQNILRLFGKWPLGKVKVLLFSTLIGGLIFDYWGLLDFNEKKIEIGHNYIPTWLIVSILIFFIILVFIDFWYFNLRLKQRQHLINLLDKTTIEEAVKVKIAESLNQL